MKLRLSSRMKKVLLSIISIFAIQLCVFAYETVLIDFPANQRWDAVYYATQGTEAILQYVPYGQSEKNWTKTLIFHSYKTLNQSGSAGTLMDTTTMQMENQNTSQLYRYLKYSEMDSIATRCVQKNSRKDAQCEIYRTSKSFEGLISMHYINKNVQEYKSTYNTWYNIVKNIRIYQSYYRDNRVMDKASSFEL